jgi:multidrug efflux pump subunit AcrA (membrane-fusion protein)
MLTLSKTAALEHFPFAVWIKPRCHCKDVRLPSARSLPRGGLARAGAIVAGMVIAYFGSTLPSSAAEPGDAGANPDLAVTVIPAKQLCFVDTLQVTGILVPRNEILVRPEREGLQIAEVLVEPGATVVSGQALARLAPLEGSKNSAVVTVQAPAAGVVSSVTAVIGTTASARAQPLFRIVKGGEMELLAEAPGNALSRLAPNQTAIVEIIGVGALAGKVRLSSTAINPQTQLGQVRVFVGGDPSLRVGAFGRATIDVGRSCGTAIPLSAVLYGQDGTVVQVVRDNRVETRNVTVGLIEAGKAEISEGLSEGDVVVVRAGAFLKDGDRVRPVNAPEPSAPK